MDIKIPNLAGGANRSIPREWIPSGQSPQMINMQLTDRVPTKRTGYTAGTDTNLTGTPFLGGHHYQDGITGLKRFWGFTTGGAFQKATVVAAWTDATNSMNFQTGLDQYIVCAEAIELDDWKNYLLVCQNNTNPKTALNGTRAGDESVLWYANTPSGNLAVLAGGDGYNDSDTKHRAKAVIELNGYVLLMNTHEEYGEGTWNNFFNRIRWSDFGHFTSTNDWNPSASGSTAGFNDLEPDSGAILAAAKMSSNTVAVLCEKTLYAGYATVDPLNPFRFLRMLDIGLYSARLWVKTPVGLFFVGNDRQIYKYEGGKSLSAIGDPIKTEFFSNINKAASGNYLIANRGFAIHFFDIHCVGFAIPTGETTTCDTIYVYDYMKNKWLDKWQFANNNNMTGWGQWERPAASNAMNLVVLGDNTETNAKTYNFDYAAVNDVSTEITGRIETGDYIVDIGANQQVKSVNFDAKGNAADAKLEVEISTDGGATWSGDWTAPQTVTVTLAATWAAYKANFDVSAVSVRFRFSDATASKNFELGQVKVPVVSSNDV